MFKSLQADIGTIDAERDIISKQMEELQLKYDTLEAHRNVALDASLQKMTDEECQQIEDAVHKLFKLTYPEDKRLSKIDRQKFSIISTAWEGHYIKFSIRVAGDADTYELTEHHAVFQDFDKYLDLKTEFVKSTAIRNKTRIKNQMLNEKLSTYIDALKPLI